MTCGEGGGSERCFLFLGAGESSAVLEDLEMQDMCRNEQSRNDGK